MHYTNRKFWLCYHQLPEDIQQIADASYELLKTNPSPKYRTKNEESGC
ncbi:MAG: hypothetical protein ACRC2J_16930 [Microcoleaceae cyanobacterium]